MPALSPLINTLRHERLRRDYAFDTHNHVAGVLIKGEDC